LKESGREPARKDLHELLARSNSHKESDVRNGHDGAQSEQHEEAVKHLENERWLTSCILYRSIKAVLPETSWLSYQQEESASSV